MYAAATVPVAISSTRLNPNKMKKIALFAVALLTTATLSAQTQLPNKIDVFARESGVATAGHVQGIALDTKREYIYISFTTLLLKVDMQGRVVGSVTGLLGHLGCLEFNDEDGRLYGSLEYKNDAIGRGILQQEGATKPVEDGFYVAIFDVKKITRKGMSAERDGVMTTVLLHTVLEDYRAEVPTALGTKTPHRYACSGFDGISFGPAFDGSGRRMLTIAYGIYGDTSREDNDYQVLLQYDTRKWAKYEATLSQKSLHRQGPAKPNGRYFLYTGNTTWGVQNMEYDASTNCWMLATYAGTKPHFANYTLFVMDGSKRAQKATLNGYEYQRKGNLLSLAEMGKRDAQNPEIRGWHNRLGAYGICALGDKMFYLTSGGGDKHSRTATLHLARFVGTEDVAFQLIE